jgi:outer membrane protein assembly factor BamB
MKTVFHFLKKLPNVFCVLLVLLIGTAWPGGYDQRAKQILDETGVKGGLIVHIGCGDGRLTAELRDGESYLVHGLDRSSQAVEEAREHIRKLGIYGPVSVECFNDKHLPYAQNLVNLIVAEDLGGVATAESMRVLVPGGVLYLKQGDSWTRKIKPRPKNTDEWTHFLHDASGNAVAHDEVVGPPRYVQWIAGPRHMRSHEHTPNINALVSAGGRIFYIADEAPASSLRQPAEWHLVARDAYNGILLWKRPFTPWFPHIINWGVTPNQLQRRLVAVGNRIYATLGLHAPLSAVDAVTGKILKVYENTRGTDEIVYHKGILLLAVRSVTDERVSELEKWAQLAVQKHSPIYARETAQPLVNQFRSIENKAGRAVLALDADTGHVLWKKTGTDASGLRVLSLCAKGERVFYQKGRDIVCLDLRTGRQLWSTPSAALRVVCDNSVICVDNKAVTALSAETGERQWKQAMLLTQVRDVFIASGSLWLGGFKPIEGKRGPSWGPYFATQRDLATGKMLRHIEPENPGHHHRCWQNKATDRYILGGRRGVEFIDLKSGDVLWHSWVRGVCRYGVMPCNGLLYAPPHACGCYIAAKLTGFYALASERDSGFPTNKSEGERLERGPAYSEGIPIRESVIHDKEWPTYRHDAQRSGRAGCTVPVTLRRKWQVDVGDKPLRGKLTSPTVAGGKVFVASVDEHRICAIDVDSGKLKWDFTADARVDSPPTLYSDQAIFGCRDGCVYSLRATDGSLAWKLRAARAERHITATGQLESVSPISGSVCVQDDVAYFTAGRSSYLDGGIELYRLDARTGKTLSVTPIYSPDPETGRQPAQFGPAYMPGSLSDILSSDDQYVYLRDMVLDKRGDKQREGNPHLFTLTGFLDDSWPHRSYWIFGTRCSLSTGCSGRDRNLIYGRLLVFDKPMIYGYGRANVHWSNQLQDGAYRLFASDCDKGKEHWARKVPIRVRVMVLADKVLFLVGPPVETDGGAGGSKENEGAILLVISTSDGAELARYPLDSSPVFDGMAAANGQLYLSLESGRLICLTGQ